MQSKTFVGHQQLKIEFSISLKLLHRKQSSSHPSFVYGNVAVNRYIIPFKRKCIGCRSKLRKRADIIDDRMKNWEIFEG